MEVLVTFHYNPERICGRILEETKDKIVLYSDFFRQEFELNKRAIKRIVPHG